MGTAPRKTNHQRCGSNPINPSSNPIPSYTSAVSMPSEDYVDMSPAGSCSKPGAVPIPSRNMSSTSLSFGTSPSAGDRLYLSFNVKHIIPLKVVRNIVMIQFEQA